MGASKIAFPGFDTPSAGFEVPLEMLSGCHGRVERQCQTLLRLPPHLTANGTDQAARQAAQNVLRYFDTSARHHHADEEEDLFPAILRSAAEADRAALGALLAELGLQHRELEQAWTELRWKLEGVWLGTLHELDANEIERMVELYRHHIAREEAELLPLAARILSIEQLDSIGRAMRARRGIKDL